MVDNEQKISRREFLIAGLGVAVGLAGREITAFILERTTTPPGTRLPEVTKIPTPSQSPSPTNTPVPTPTPEKVIIYENLPSEVALRATATALAKNDLQTSFKESGGFTKEIFEQIQKGLLNVEVSLERRTSQRVEKSVGIGTGWVAKIDNNSLYLVVNNHFFPEGETATGVKFGRPAIDKDFFNPTRLIIASFKSPDLAVIKAEGDFKSKTPFQQLDWQDNFPFSPKDNVLIVGFPHPFKRSEGLLDYATLGEVGPVIRSINNEKTQWIAKSFVTGGSSGSPVIILKGNKPIVGGIVYAASGKTNLEINKNEYHNQEAAIFTSLQLTPLINAVAPL